MSLYNVRYIHRIAPHQDDTEGPFEIRDGAFSNRSTLAAALRKIHVMMSGERLRTFRVEGDKVIAFPTKGIWHAFVIEPADNYEATYEILPGGQRRLRFSGKRRTGPARPELR